MTEQLTNEDWKDIKKQNQEARKERRDRRTELVYDFCIRNDIAIEEKTEFHLRLKKEGYSWVDVFPTSSKVMIHKPRSKNKYVFVNLDKWLIYFYRQRHKDNQIASYPCNL